MASNITKISPTKSEGASLEKRAERIRTGLRDILLATTSIVDLALTIGEDLLQAKEEVGRGNWLSWLKRECDLKERSAERYMFLARHRAELKSNSTRVSDLSLSGALRLIKKGRSRQEKRRRKTQKLANPLDALGWWGGASLEQRRHFLDGVGKGILTSLPAEWRPLLEERAVGHLSALRLLDLLEDRLERDGTVNATVLVGKLRKLLDQPKLIELTAMPVAGAA
jgi:Protein of unknown function (DUF3102)